MSTISHPRPASALPETASAELRTLVRGVVLTPADPGYVDAVTVYNAAVRHRPAAVVRVAATADVVATLGFARRHGLGVSVLAGGHSVAGHGIAGDLVIDLSALRGVVVDPLNRTVAVAGGATWADVDAATQAHQLAVPGGRISDTGVAGVTLGGGEGWLSARHGLSCDNLLAVELVMADGRVVDVDDHREPELFWALRGGGGNFGVVTSMTFRVHPVGPLVLGGLLAYPLAATSQVLALLDELVETGGGDFGGAATIMLAPPAPFVPGDVVGRPVLGVVPAWFGTPDAGQEFLRPLRETVTPLVDAVAPMPYTALQSQLDGGNPSGMRNRWSSGFVPELTALLVSRLQDACARMPSAQSQVIIYPLGRAVRDVPADATAFPSRHGGRWLVHATAAWDDPAADAAAQRWIDGIAAATREAGETGSYLNLEDPDPERVRWAMGDARYRRLQQVKAVWDPQDVFRNCVHIELPR